MSITILALLWAIVGIVAAAIDHHRRGLDFTVGGLIVGALVGTLALFLDIVILRGRK